MNSYYFARLSWGDTFGEIEQDFYSIFGEKKMEARQLLQKREAVLSEVSKWNAPLFPSRLIDPEKVDTFADADLIVKDIINWQNMLEPFKSWTAGGMPNMDSLVSFYVHFAENKLEEYLRKWEEKAGSCKMDL